MKKFGWFLMLFAAAFLGVLAAMRAESLFSKGDSRQADAAWFAKSLEQVEPAQYQPVSAPFDFRAAAKKVMPSVVSVDKSEAQRDFWSDRVSIVNSATGSGVILSADGYVITNNHMVANAAALTVRTADGKSYNAKLIGADPRTDLAVIKIDGASGLQAIEMGDSSKVEVGEWVMAVGNPLGYANTVSAGVVSSLNRTLLAGENSTLLTDAIQTDASINEGNSGGALTDDRGRLIGINSAIATPSGGSVGIGFAIPVNRAKSVVQELMKYGHVRYGDPGILLAQVTMSDPRAQRVLARMTNADPPKQGLIVRAILRGGTAAAAGIHPNDILLEADGKVLTEPTDFDRISLGKRVGQTLSLKFWSAGKVRTVTLNLTEASSSPDELQE